MNDATRNVEVEVKFWVPDLAPFPAILSASGGVLKKERVFERNIRFDTPDEALREKLQLLRLRQDTAVTLTFKGPAADDTHSEARVREEIEVKVDHFDNAVAIFQRLGLNRLQVYEKYRQTWQLGAVEVVLDELPYGNFVELEGEATALKMAAPLLGFDWTQRLLTNYLAIMGLVQEAYQLPFDDLTFANFKGVAIDMPAILKAAKE
jgi:adenylate cyclase class 2